MYRPAMFLLRFWWVRGAVPADRPDQCRRVQRRWGHGQLGPGPGVERARQFLRFAYPLQSRCHQTTPWHPPGRERPGFQLLCDL